VSYRARYSAAAHDSRQDCFGVLFPNSPKYNGWYGFGAQFASVARITNRPAYLGTFKSAGSLAQ